MVRVSLYDDTIQALAETSSARFVGGDAQIDIPEVFRADLKRLREQAPSVSDAASRPSSQPSDGVHMVVEEQPRLVGGRAHLNMVATTGE